MDKLVAKPLIDKAGDVAPLGDDFFARARPAREVMSPEVYQNLKRGRGRPKSESPKVLQSLRLDPVVLEAFKATGAGWQTRINEVLRRAVIEGDIAPPKGQPKAVKAPR